MEARLQLEQMCRESWCKLCRTERALGVDSPEADIFRSEWSALDRAYKLVFKEKIDYFNICIH